MLNLRSSLFALWAAMSALACDAAPIVNEMMASNQTVVANPLEGRKFLQIGVAEWSRNRPTNHPIRLYDFNFFDKWYIHCCIGFNL